MFLHINVLLTLRKIVSLKKNRPCHLLVPTTKIIGYKGPISLNIHVCVSLKCDAVFLFKNLKTVQISESNQATLNHNMLEN